MESRHIPLTPYDAIFKTSMARRTAREAVERVAAFQADTEKEQRVKEHRCPACWYFRRYRIGGAATTRWHCGICAEPQFAGSTATDAVCRKCAKEHSLCTQCGGDFQMRDRRRKWPEPKPTRQKGTEE